MKLNKLIFCTTHHKKYFYIFNIHARPRREIIEPWLQNKIGARLSLCNVSSIDLDSHSSDTAS